MSSRPRSSDKPVPTKAADHDLGFFIAWLKSPLRTGAITSSSRALAGTMAAMADPDIPGSVVELGPGTGPVTEALIARGFAPERLVLIEMNREFRALLLRRYPGITVIDANAYDLRHIVDQNRLAPLCAVVSSLPLLTQPPADRSRLVHDAFQVLAPNQPFIQFTYSHQSPVPIDHAEMAATRSKRIWWNLPPAMVWAYRSRGLIETGEIPKVP